MLMKGFADKKESKMKAIPYFSVNLESPSHRMGPRFLLVKSTLVQNRILTAKTQRSVPGMMEWWSNGAM